MNTKIEPGALEVRLSKRNGRVMTAAEMIEFLAELSRWAEAMGTKGYTIESVPDAGPGTMVWKAVRSSGLDGSGASD